MFDILAYNFNSYKKNFKLFWKSFPRSEILTSQLFLDFKYLTKPVFYCQASFWESFGMFLVHRISTLNILIHSSFNVNNFFKIFQKFFVYIIYCILSHLCNAYKIGKQSSSDKTDGESNHNRTHDAPINIMYFKYLCLNIILTWTWKSISFFKIQWKFCRWYYVRWTSLRILNRHTILSDSYLCWQWECSGCWCCSCHSYE